MCVCVCVCTHARVFVRHSRAGIPSYSSEKPESRRYMLGFPGGKKVRRPVVITEFTSRWGRPWWEVCPQ